MFSFNFKLRNNKDAIAGIQAIAVIGAVIIIGLLTVVAASGMIHVPVLTSLLGTDEARDLGVEIDYALFDEMLEDQGIVLNDEISDFTLTSEILYSDAAPMDLSLTSSQLSSYLQATNNEGPLKDIQVKLGTDNQAEMAAYVDLADLGYDFKGPVYASGTFEKASDSSINIEIDDAKVGLLPLPGGTAEQAEEELENLINDHLAKMPGLQIDELEVVDGNLNFEGDFPTTFDSVEE
ncbi:hypothetical protein J2755_001234 [Methanohalophilus levihalophilus]|uniref:hypothetical protein n=1 Tax=Methanohalophilus levihalophilus TaxID=1431282 RepID=UPI001FDA9474|nr:hypothetical protein [Methanohalophilus levihalophilus]MBP2030300.1 hypothetical protein [Methanohalophilus levihalophilus]